MYDNINRRHHSQGEGLYNIGFSGSEILYSGVASQCYMWPCIFRCSITLFALFHIANMDLSMKATHCCASIAAEPWN